MARRADARIDGGLPAAHWDGAGTNHIVQTPAGVLYAIYINAGNDVAFRKSLDGGLTWSGATLVSTATFTNCTSVAVWYDRWSNIAAGLIHVVYSDSGVDDTAYRTIDTESSDALSTETVIFAGGTTAAGGHLSVTRAVGGNVYCKTVIDAGAEGGFFRLLNADVPNGAWASRTVDETIATLDQMRLLPDFDAADSQDIMALFQDASVTELSRKLYDDSANSWAETSISASITELSTATAFCNFNAAPDIANTRHVVVAWNATDAANQDLLCWVVDAGAITAKTDVVTNATDDCGLAAIQIDPVTGWWYVFYGGPSTGASTWPSAMHIYMKVSTDEGATWGPETLVDTHVAGFALNTLYTAPILYKGPWFTAYGLASNTRDLYMSVDRSVPHAAYAMGV